MHPILKMRRDPEDVVVDQIVAFVEERLRQRDGVSSATGDAFRQADEATLITRVPGDHRAPVDRPLPFNQITPPLGANGKPKAIYILSAILLILGLLLASAFLYFQIH